MHKAQLGRLFVIEVCVNSFCQNNIKYKSTVFGTITMERSHDVRNEKNGKPGG